jgi:hypothetical protein
MVLDEAALFEPTGKKDPWYQLMQCRNGQIYPYSDKLLAVHSKGSGIRQKLRAIEGLTGHNWSDDGEAIFLFTPALFEQVAGIVKPKRKRRLNDGQRKAVADRLRAYHFKPKSTHVDAEEQGKNRPISAQAIVGAE